MNHDIKVIAFDFWGVFATLDHPMYAYMNKRGIDPKKYSESIHNLIIAHDLGKLTEQKLLEQCSKIIGLELPYELCRFTFRKELLNKNLIEIVKKLKSQYKLVLFSNNSKEYCETYLFGTGLDKLFDDLILSYQVGFRKPAKEMYKLLIQRVGVRPEEILFVDDEISKFKVAEELGIKTFQYKNGETDKILEGLVASQSKSK